MAIALVTGTSSGIGLATAVTLARGGHTVIATMRNLEGSDELRKIVSAERLPLTVATLNVDDDASVSDAVNKVLAENGRIDILVNNAGILGSGSIEEAPIGVFRQVMETNFFGALRCIKAVIPSMREHGHGYIINVTSIAGRLAIAPMTPYAASKWALEALSECLAQEMKAFNIRVAIIEPGIIATSIFSKAIPAPEGGPYPHLRRLSAVLSASLTKPSSPYVVAEQIRQIVDGNGGQLRYPVGPYAEPLLRWRANNTDEEWVDIGAESDTDYRARIRRELGLDISI
jgi:NAD(P)-dependent dehydrogenase (short-subunit alcohol dehydrogenase family)